MLKRILTATLSAVAVVGFVSLVGNWTQALDAEFLVFGQTGGTGTGSGGGATGGTTTITKIIPQVANGTFDGGNTDFNTVIQIMNAGTSAVTLTAEFFNQDGTASTLTFFTLTGGQDTSTASASFTGSLSSTIVPANDSLILATDTEGSPPGVVNWGRITADATVTIGAAFNLFLVAEGAGALTGLNSRVGVPASDSDIQKLVMPRWRNTAVDKDTSTAFAIVNTSSESITVTGTLYSGAQATASQTLTLAAGNQTAQFVKEFFGLTNETGDTFTQVVLESSSAALAATALVFQGNIQTSVPIGKLQ